MDGTVFWTILAFAFVIGTLVVVFGVLRYWKRASEERERSDRPGSLSS